METLLKDCLGVSIYIDDILVTGPTCMEHLANLERVLERLGKSNLKLNRAKCFIMRLSVEYLGHVIDQYGLHPTEEKIKAIRLAPTPRNVTELQAFLGIVNYYGKFLPNLSSQLEPLHGQLQKRSKWSWGPRQREQRRTLYRPIRC